MFSSFSILVVDDDLFARYIIKHHLTRMGFKSIFEASDGEQALETLRSGKMQLVIADRYMPKLNGLELFCSIQTDKRLKGTPFIMITIEDSQDKVEDAKKLGIEHYLIKPFDAHKFDTKVHKVLQNSAEILS